MAGTVRKTFNSPNAPKPGGPYSHGVIVDKTMYISGVIGNTPDNGDLVTGGAVAQAEQALKNMGAILETAGATYDNVVKVTVLLADIKDWLSINEVYKKCFAKRLPARSAYQVGALPKGALIEIESIAILGDIVDVSL